MTAFRYRAATHDGQVVEGIVQATSQRTALDELRRQRLVPVDLAHVSPTEAGRTGRRLAKLPAVTLFARTIATLLAAGVPLDRAVAFAAGQARHPAVAAAARDIHDDLRGGAGFATALARQRAVLGSLFPAMAAAGEESGALDDAMARLADHLDETAQLRSQVRASLVYPALMAAATGIGVTVLLLFVVPRFVEMLAADGATLPVSTALLVAASRVIVGGWWILLLFAAVGALAARAWLGRPENRRRWHAWRLSIPLVGELERDLATARFARAFGMLLESGRPVLPALRTARGIVANTELAARLDDAAEAVNQGRRVHVALAGTLPNMATELLAVGEESGRLDALSLRVAESYDAEVRRTLRTLVAIIEPALILTFGLIVGFVALAMLQAIYGFNRSAF